MKKPNFIMCFAFILFCYFIIESAQAQNTQDTSSNSPSTNQVQQLPGRIAGPIIFNNGIVRPLENLDPFQYTTLQKNGGTTFEKRIEQKSNVELNKSEENKSENPQVNESEFSERTNQTQVEEESTSSFIPLPPSKGAIYKWTDKSGVKHYTNVIKSIPPEYKDQATKTSE
jgi:hypothetical protein